MDKFAKYYILLLFFTLIITPSGAADITAYKDSANNILNNKQISDSLKIVQLCNWALYVNQGYNDNAEAQNIIVQAQNIANKHSNNDLKLPIYGASLFIEQDVSKVILILDVYKQYIEQSKNPLARAIGWKNLGEFDREQGTEALQYYFKALDEIKDSDHYVALRNIYHNIGAYYRGNEDYENAIKYFQLALDAVLKSDNQHEIAEAWVDLSVVHYETEDEENIKTAYDALINAYDIYKKYKDTPGFEEEWSNLYIQILVNFSNFYYIQGDIANVKRSLQEALKEPSYLNTHIIKMECYHRLSALAISEKDYPTATKYLKEAISLLNSGFEKIPAEYSYLAHTLYTDLAESLKREGKYKEAMEYYTIGMENYKHNYDYQLSEISKFIEAKYQLQNHQQELEATQDSLTSKKRQNILYIVVVVVLIMALIFLYLFQRYRIKGLKEREQHQIDKTKLLELEKENAEINAQLNNEEAGRLQKELVAGSLLVEHKNKVVKDLKDFISQHEELKKYKRDLQHILLQESSVENNIEDFKTTLKGVHPDFYKRLQEKANNKLTSLDLKYCRLIFLKFSSKEMADMLSVEPKTIRVTKYRLKQKLGLGKDDDLNMFIESVI
ncbi:MAG: tetratricopeptide repeat protein [Dysgonomonas sp.]|nr:tetratricopeptide repeat protein [Dysgonomonas sp.]